MVNHETLMRQLGGLNSGLAFGFVAVEVVANLVSTAPYLAIPLLLRSFQGECRLALVSPKVTLDQFQQLLERYKALKASLNWLILGMFSFMQVCVILAAFLGFAGKD